MSMERLAVRRAVAGDRGVAELARQRRVRVVAGPAPEIVDRHAGDDDDVEPDLGDLEAGDRITLGDRHRRWSAAPCPAPVSATVSDTVSGGALDAGVTAVDVVDGRGVDVVDASRRAAPRTRPRARSGRAVASMPVPHSW